MARTGLYKSEVKKARDALIAQGKHPSVDAVRIELGNTGSKTTIHKYLRELDEEGAGGGRTSVSEAIQDLVERLAGQLQQEANAQIDAIQAQTAENERRHSAELQALRKELRSTEERLEHTEQRLESEVGAHKGTRNALNEEAIVRHTARQEAAGLKERLNENEAHRASLEEKHKHAREALEHYRQSVKEQRDQEQRKHEQQVQQLQAEIRQLQQSLSVKQDEVTRLNREGARLVADLAHSQKAVRENEFRIQQLETKADALHTANERCKVLEAQLSTNESLSREVTHLQEKLGDLRQRYGSLEGSLKTMAESRDQAIGEAKAAAAELARLSSKSKMENEAVHSNRISQ